MTAARQDLSSKSSAMRALHPLRAEVDGKVLGPLHFAWHFADTRAMISQVRARKNKIARAPCTSDLLMHASEASKFRDLYYHGRRGRLRRVET